MASKKRHMSKSEEFDILKIVLDKFLLLGTFIMALGIYLIVSTIENFVLGFSVLAVGSLIMIFFAMILVKEYRFMQH